MATKTPVGQALTRDDKWMYTWFSDGTIQKRRQQRTHNGKGTQVVMGRTVVVNERIEHNDVDFHPLIKQEHLGTPGKATFLKHGGLVYEGDYIGDPKAHVVGHIRNRPDVLEVALAMGMTGADDPRLGIVPEADCAPLLSDDRAAIMRFIERYDAHLLPHFANLSEQRFWERVVELREIHGV